MSSSSEQIWLGDRNVESFMDVTPEIMKEIDALRDLSLQYKILRWIVTLALFYRSE